MSVKKKVSYEADWALQATAGLCAGVELAFRPPGTAAWLFDKVK